MKFLNALLALATAAPGMAAAEAPLRPFTNYQAIMWVGDSIHKQPAQWPLFQQRLRAMGVTAGMVSSGGDPKVWTDAGMPYYVENIVNRGLCLKFNSTVTDWNKFVTRWKDPRDEASLVRDYCLDDPQWRTYARTEMQRAARKNAAAQPLLYNIRDELSTTLSANPFDYDFSPSALNPFRDWLKTQYPSLVALNAQWQTKFAAWEDVKPFTTDQIKNRMASGDALPQGRPDWQAVQRIQYDPRTASASRTRWNLAPWCDFRSYMDLSLARALDDCRQAARQVDPHTPVGIEGTQMPHAFGGYDLWRLSQVLDWIEPYDIGNAREILGSFMPNKTFVTTVFEKDTNPALRRLWHLLLLGDRGCILWWSEDCLDWKREDLALTSKAQALAPALKEMTSPLAQLFLRARRASDPIAIHYSQPSIQVDWLLESTVDGSTWLRRFSSYEASHNRMAKTRNGWLKALQDLGYSPQFLSQEELEQGQLAARHFRALVLPTSRALSDKELAQLAKAGPNTALLWDGLPGAFDDHGTLRAAPPSAFPATPSPACHYRLPGQTPVAHPGAIASYAQARLQPTMDADWSTWLAAATQQLPRPVVVPRDARARIHRFELGKARLLGIERGVDYHMSEDLKQAGGNEALETPLQTEARLAEAAHVYDLRSGKYLGQTDRITFALDPWRPALFALLPEPVAEAQLMAYLGAQ